MTYRIFIHLLLHTTAPDLKQSRKMIDITTEKAPRLVRYILHQRQYLIAINNTRIECDEAEVIVHQLDCFALRSMESYEVTGLMESCTGYLQSKAEGSSSDTLIKGSRYVFSLCLFDAAMEYILISSLSAAHIIDDKYIHQMIYHLAKIIPLETSVISEVRNILYRTYPAFVRQFEQCIANMTCHHRAEARFHGFFHRISNRIAWALGLYRDGGTSGCLTEQEREEK